MTRRKFVPAAAAAAAAAAGATSSNEKPQFYEMTTYHLRNSADNQRQKTVDLLGKTIVPALARNGAGSTTCFASSVAPGGPFLVSITAYPSMGAIEETHAKLVADEVYAKQMTAFASAKGLGFTRVETSLLRAFPGIPTMPAMPAKKSVFELRTYESDNAVTLGRKIKMFEGGEAGIFRRLGMEPLFFAETVYGPNMPNLVYMLAFDDLAGREKLWKAFGSDPDWAKLRATPGLSDAEIVSNISSVFLSPLRF